MTLNEDVIVLVDCAVVVYVAQQIFGIFGADVGIVVCGFLAYNNVFFVNHFVVFYNTQQIFTCGNVIK